MLAGGGADGFFRMLYFWGCSRYWTMHYRAALASLMHHLFTIRIDIKIECEIGYISYLTLIFLIVNFIQFVFSHAIYNDLNSSICIHTPVKVCFGSTYYNFKIDV